MSTYYRGYNWPKLTLRSSLSCLTDIKSRLDDEAEALFRQGPFGHWLDYIKKHRGDPMAIVLLLQHQVAIENGDPETLYFRIGPHTRRYGRQEFNLITGLPFGLLPTQYNSDGNSFISRLFPHLIVQQPRDGPYRLRLSDLMTLYRNMSDLDTVDKVRICSVVMVEKVFFGHQDNVFVDNVLLNAVRYLDAWNEFPWGSYIWTYTYKQLDGGFERRLAHQAGKMTLYGFQHAFEVWIFEMFPRSEYYFSKNESYPRGMRWEKKSSKTLLRDDWLTFIDMENAQHIPREGLVADEFEQQQGWYIRSHEWFQHIASRQASKRPRLLQVRGDEDADVADDPMDVDKWETFNRVHQEHNDLMTRMTNVEQELARMRVSGRHSVSSSRPTGNTGSMPVHYSHQDARQSFHMGGGMSSSFRSYEQFGQSSTFGMTGPTCFTPPAHGMSGGSFFSGTETVDPGWGSFTDLLTGGSAFSGFGQPYGGMSGAGGSSYGAGGSSYGAGGSSYGAGGSSYGAGGSSYGAGGSSYGAAVDTVVRPAATTYAERADVEAESEPEAEEEAEEESEAYETESDTQLETVVEKTPRPQRERRPGEKTREPWTSGSKFTSRVKKVFGGLKRKTKK